LPAANLVLPLAVAIFRMTSTVANLAVALFIAHLYGIDPTLTQLVGACVVALAVSVGTVGLPGQASFFTSMAPICLALGVPLDLLPILLAVEVIPDIFRTVGNVTADMAAVAIADRKKTDQPAG
jgi:Na+/H+-dicarboxylate symporter